MEWRELLSGGRIGELLRPSGQCNFLAEKLERENSHLAAELGKYSGLQVSIILWRKHGVRELPSSGGLANFYGLQVRIASWRKINMEILYRSR
jgi:hypothetical protein